MGKNDCDDKKEVTKQALKEWLDERFDQFYADVGKWVVRLVITTLFFSMIYLFLWTNGWVKK